MVASRKERPDAVSSASTGRPVNRWWASSSFVPLVEDEVSRSLASSRYRNRNNTSVARGVTPNRSRQYRIVTREFVVYGIVTSLTEPRFGTVANCGRRVLTLGWAKLRFGRERRVRCSVLDTLARPMVNALSAKLALGYCQSPSNGFGPTSKVGSDAGVGPSLGSEPPGGLCVCG